MGGGAMRTATTVANIAVSNGLRRGLTERNFPVNFSAWKAVDSNLSSGIKLVTADLMPRVVFGGGLPTLQEAKEATRELADALEKVYLSSPNSIGNVEDTVQNRLQNKNSLVPAIPGNAIEAIELLCKNSEVQNVVSSIASDTNVLKAVLQNEELQKFMHSYTKSDCLNQSAAEFFESSSNNEKSNNGTGYIHKIKTRVVEMVRKLSDKFWDFFGENYGTTIGVSAAMGLAIMVIMLMCTKRRT